MSTKRVYVETYGCQMNKLDSELAEQALAGAGFSRTEDVRDADLIVLNTCSVRDHAEHRVVSRLGRLKPGGRERKDGSVLAVIGCMAQREGQALWKVAPHLNVVAGTKEFVRLPELYERALAGERVAALELEGEFEYARDPRYREDPHKAWVTVMRGCDLHCTYCIVPTTRGPEESRPLEQVVHEVEHLVEDGVVEVTLLGQTVNSWGKQLPGSPDLADLLAALDGIPGLLRTRFITSHPNFFQNGFWRRVKGLRTFCPYVHVPAQSGSDRVLKRMTRLYDVARYRDMVAEARAEIPGIALASDWIVGFPGESEADFQRSLDLLREVRFAQSFVFMYSPRPGTPAEQRLEDDVPEAEKNRRCNALIDAQEQIMAELHQAQVGNTVEVLVDGSSKTRADRLAGRTRHHELVVFEGSPALQGRLVQVELERATASTLYGRPVETPAALAPRRRALPVVS